MAEPFAPYVNHILVETRALLADMRQDNGHSADCFAGMEGRERSDDCSDICKRLAHLTILLGKMVEVDSHGG